jgi:hypothetical protein
MRKIISIDVFVRLNMLNGAYGASFQDKKSGQITPDAGAWKHYRRLKSSVLLFVQQFSESACGL